MGGVAQAGQGRPQVAVVVQGVDDEFGQQAVARLQMVVAQIRREPFPHGDGGAHPLPHVLAVATAGQLGRVVAGIGGRVGNGVVGFRGGRGRGRLGGRLASVRIVAGLEGIAV
ncbi:hypothetical protein D3C71_1517050 [compost metagenome]